MSPTKDLVATAVEAGHFKTLAKAIEAAGLVETLKGRGPFTVFAPSDEAFVNLPSGTLDNLLKPENKEQLKAILLTHVVPGDLLIADVKKIKEVKTVGGAMLEGVRKEPVSRARVVAGDDAGFVIVRNGRRSAPQREGLHDIVCTLLLERTNRESDQDCPWGVVGRTPVMLLILAPLGRSPP